MIIITFVFKMVVTLKLYICFHQSLIEVICPTTAYVCVEIKISRSNPYSSVITIEKIPKMAATFKLFIILIKYFMCIN